MSETRAVTAIEVLEDFSHRARCDEGYLKLRRLRCQNRYADGDTSREYRVDVIDRPALDAVAVLLHRQGPRGLEALTRQQLRPAAYFRDGKPAAVPDPKRYLFVEELVAGVLESSDRGEEGIRRRAAIEAYEEAGFRVSPDRVTLLGAPFFVAPGIVSEAIFLAAADVTGLHQETHPPGDGSPLEEGATLRWWPIEELLAACRRGEVRDAKTELALTRFLAKPV
jgi:ADP-ribose pyrophosphatase